MNSIKWLFFDLGSTLIDETECIKKRCNNIIEKNNIDKDEFYIKVRECAKTNSYAVKTAAKYYGVDTPRCTENWKNFILMLMTFYINYPKNTNWELLQINKSAHKNE